MVQERYMVVFGYGSVVFFNCEEALQRQGLESVQKHASSIVGMPKSEGRRGSRCDRSFV